MEVKTVEDVRKAVREIRECQHDDDAAHSKEDELYVAVLRYIAEQDETRRTPVVQARIRMMARNALKTKELNFARYTG